MAIVKAISIKQPWAWCIVHGLKPVENRSWKTKLRGRVLIHAGKKFDQAGFEWLLENKLIPVESKKDQFLFGGIVGEAEIVDCVEDLDSIWFFGPYGFLLESVREHSFKPLRGQLGFFNVDTSTLEE
ncbi:ASCH domain-containing protein [Teredinibacter purpureus]|uniref:ASCH domain-containing protein n=1 Tax=Teredinibacter purpureus TaxID=2731756 RepID=UPI001910F843|nr:ASCH domain-containing protein [Teredinibacter purpureus]